MNELPRQIGFTLPAWIFDECELERRRESDEARMELAVELARRNIERGGGPFGAALFDADTGELIAPGVNQVVPQGCSLLHAEVVALAFAQARLKTFTLASGRYELFTSSDPCVQCLGACHWAGLSRLVCGAPLELAEQAGFDEGPRAPDWRERLSERGTAVTVGVLAEQAGAVLRAYSDRGLLRYNARG